MSIPYSSDRQKTTPNNDDPLKKREKTRQKKYRVVEKSSATNGNILGRNKSKNTAAILQYVLRILTVQRVHKCQTHTQTDTVVHNPN